MGLVFFLGLMEKGGRPWEPVAHSGEWTTSWGGEAGKGLETEERGGASGRERAGNWGERQSQWPTLKSGPLAWVERP